QWQWLAHRKGAVISKRTPPHRQEPRSGFSELGTPVMSAGGSLPVALDVFGKTEAAEQHGVGEEGDLVDLAAAQGEDHRAPGLRAQVAAEGRLAVGARRAYL